MKGKAVKVLLVLLLISVILFGAVAGGVLWLKENHIFVGGRMYPEHAEVLNLRGSGVSEEDYRQIREKVPDTEVYWDVPFQNTSHPDDIRYLSLTALSEEDIAQIAYFTQLQTVNAVGCRDYDALMQLQQTYPNIRVLYTVQIQDWECPMDIVDMELYRLKEEEIPLFRYLPDLKTVDATQCDDYAQLAALQEQYPELDVSYKVTIFDTDYEEDTTGLTFENLESAGELLEQLGNLPKLESVHLVEPAAPAEELTALLETYPELAITWEKTVLDQMHTSEDTEFDFSGMTLESTDDVEAAMAYFPNAEKVILCDCGLDNETLAAFREKMRPEYKVVWSVTVTGIKVRTDETVFHSSAHEVALIDEQSYDLFYCEDMIVVDIGHSHVKYIEWVKGMPNLKYLILADNWIKDLTPISTCKNLIYLELFMNQHIPDYTPLQGCTALQDLNLARTYADPTPLAQMTWLDNLWINMTGIEDDERKLLSESLTDTHIEFDYGWPTGGGWRQLQNYFDMRDLMGMPYFGW